MDTIGLFGNRYVLTASYYWFEGQEEPALAERTAVLASVRLDPAEAYDPHKPSARNKSAATAIAVLICVGVLTLIRNSAKPGKWKWSLGHKT
jgi:hypothetical protein